MPGENCWFDAWLSALVVKMGVRQETAEIGVALLRLAEEGKMMAIGESYLRAGDRPEAPGAGALRELHRAVQAVVVRERQRVVSQLQGAEDELIDVRSAFEEGEVRVGVEFGVGRHRLMPSYERLF